MHTSSSPKFPLTRVRKGTGARLPGQRRSDLNTEGPGEQVVPRAGQGSPAAGSTRLTWRLAHTGQPPGEAVPCENRWSGGQPASHPALSPGSSPWTGARAAPRFPAEAEPRRGPVPSTGRKPWSYSPSPDLKSFINGCFHLHKTGLNPVSQLLTHHSVFGYMVTMLSLNKLTTVRRRLFSS